MNTNVLIAVFKRNFVGYFASPTGYVFICVFVLLSSFAAFWSNEFFNANLANLDQLNKVFPLIMLIFIPAITMSVWADEQRQGTDELVLTIPASDFDIVLGKYLAAVAIFSVSLLFSLVCNFAVLQTLGSPDAGLFLGTYVGYWVVGLAMLAIGMLASFLTANLTIAFVFGVVFNLPLIFAAKADAIFARGPALAINAWSIGERLADFGHGVISLSGLAYFLLTMAIMLYLSMVLIGRRHWFSGAYGEVMIVHFVVRTAALALIAIGLVVLFTRYDSRLDVTSERLSSLSPDTRKLLAELQLERPVQIDAFISAEVPELYVQTRLNLLNMLRELEARGSDVRVRINPTERFSEEAARAEQRFGIEPQRVATFERGVLSVDHIFMGVAMSCGLQKVILPFIDRGIPVEYELVRSIATVAQQQRKRVGVLTTDAPLFGGFNMMNMSTREDWPIVDELEKQYEVERVDPSLPITKPYDVLLAVQPSSLGPEELDNFLDVLKHGQKTAIFEDPLPAFEPSVPATSPSAPRRPPGGMNPMMMRQQPRPKGNIGELWQFLGVDFTTEEIIWQDYNPIRKLTLPKEFVFVDEGAGVEEPFNEDSEISSNLQHMLFPFPGAVSRLNASPFEVTPLVRTGTKTGTVAYSDMLQMTPFGPRGGLNPRRFLRPTNKEYNLAVAIHGQIDAPNADEDTGDSTDTEKDDPGSETSAEKPDGAKPQVDIDVVLVSDIDMLTRQFFQLREQGDVPENGIPLDFDNVTFVLNALDSLAGDTRFIEIRKRRAKHRTLMRVEEKTEEAKEDAIDTRKQYDDEFNDAVDKEQKKFDKKIEDLRKSEGMDPQQMIIEVAVAQQDGQRRIDRLRKTLEREKDKKVNEIERKLALQIREVQDSYKMWAVVLPPIPPLLVGVVVFFFRRSREREGIAQERLR